MLTALWIALAVAAAVALAYGALLYVVIFKPRDDLAAGLSDCKPRPIDYAQAPKEDE